MNVKEFRIGNLLSSKCWGGFGKIDGIEVTEEGFEIRVKGYVHPYEKDKYFDLCPIELSEDWLFKFGFEKEEHGFYEKEYCFFDLLNISENGFIIYAVLETYTISQEIKYVHELQNLYYTLTGEELETKYELYDYK